MPAQILSIDTMLAEHRLWRGQPASRPRGRNPSGHDALDAVLPEGGWPEAALTEFLLAADGLGELRLLLPTLARLTQAAQAVAVVAPPYLPFPDGWRQAGVDLAFVHVIDAAPRDALWATEQCLRSGACAAVIGWPLQADAQALRRLQVAADSGDCLGFALRDRKHAANPSPAALRVEYARDARGQGAWHVRKCRGGPAPAQTYAPGTA
jgi:cell division inhibitor SulA